MFALLWKTQASPFWEVQLSFSALGWGCPPTHGMVAVCWLRQVPEKVREMNTSKHEQYSTEKTNILAAIEKFEAMRTTQG